MGQFCRFSSVKSILDVGLRALRKACRYGVTVKLKALKSLPNEFESTSGPLVAPAGITAVTEVELTPVTEVKALRPILTEFTPSSPSPVIVTTVPTGPDDGENEEMLGAAVAVELHAGAEAIAISEGREEVGAAAAGTK